MAVSLCREKAAKSAAKRGPSPTQNPKPNPKPHHGEHHDAHDEEKRQLGDLFGIIGKNAAKGAAKIG